MKPDELSWAIRLRANGLTTVEIARVMAVSVERVRQYVPPANYRPSTFVNGRGWV